MKSWSVSKSVGGKQGSSTVDQPVAVETQVGDVLSGLDWCSDCEATGMSRAVQASVRVRCVRCELSISGPTRENFPVFWVELGESRPRFPGVHDLER
ncbi:hypothetical protein BaRGS_00018258 [Batillaria attramentaria]|uniref:Uncharacterized protein n=1 Tax=Batillaria attramentaria TaxID=370345 RepID=A0ABD0KTD7_9CAEN